MISDENLNHPCFHHPQSLDSHVWRYLNVPKLASFLQSRSLYLARLDRMPDAFEGKIGKCAIDAISQIGSDHPEMPPLLNCFQDTVEAARRHFVNCWCLQEHESDALWRIYGGMHDAGVAIRTTYGRLINHLPATCYIGQVKYLDYDVASYQLNNVFNYVMHKRTQFSFEHEVRIVRTPYEFAYEGWKPPPKWDRVPKGTSSPVDPNELVESLVTSPYAESWFVEMVRGLAATYGLKARVETSRMI